MERIDNYAALSKLLSAQLHRGVRTNAFASADEYRAEIAAGKLFVHSFDGGLLLLHDRGDYQRLNFYLHDKPLPRMKWDKPTVVEIAARPRDAAMAATAADFMAAGFALQFYRRRVTRPAGIAVPPGPMPVETVQVQDAEAMMEFLYQGFDPVIGCLPNLAELKEILARGEILCVRQNGRMIGLLHFNPGRTSTEMRHLAVRPECRHCGAAQSMVAVYLERTGLLRSQLWVREGNTAQVLYDKNHYAPDGWRSAVLRYD